MYEKDSKVSIIVPVYNAGRRLESTIISLIEQSLKEIEIIIVDDASTDDSSDVIERLSIVHDNIVSIGFSENRGVHEARLAGIELATSPWIGFLDADDFARPNMFRVLYGLATENDVDIVICGSERVTEGRKPITTKLSFSKNKKIDSNVFEKFCRFEFGTGMLWNKLYRSDVIKPCADMHFPWRQNINEDLLVNIGCFYRAHSVYLCKEILHEYVFNIQSVTSKSNNAKSYVDTFRAAALAVRLYSDLGENALHRIIDLYRTQLSWGDYLIDDIVDIAECGNSLREAVDLIYGVSPSALALLSARRTPSLGVRYALRVLLKRIRFYR